MIRFIQFLGLLLLLPAFGALVWDFVALLDSGSFPLSAWGDLWYKLHAPSLNLYQAAVERHLSVTLWDDTLAPLLLLPALLLFGVPGAVLAGGPLLLESLKREDDD